MLETCSSGEPNERHCTSKGIAPAVSAASIGGNSDFDSKRLSSLRAVTLFCIAPFPLKRMTNLINPQALWFYQVHRIHLLRLNSRLELFHGFTSLSLQNRLLFVNHHLILNMRMLLIISNSTRRNGLLPPSLPRNIQTPIQKFNRRRGYKNQPEDLIQSLRLAAESSSAIGEAGAQFGTRV